MNNTEQPIMLKYYLAVLKKERNTQKGKSKHTKRAMTED